MPKMRSKGSVKKRFKFTGGGKIKRKRAFHSHKLGSKSKKRKRKLVRNTVVSSNDQKRIKKLMLT